jgi:DNA-binding YbaB/EbfC family protein
MINLNKMMKDAQQMQEKLQKELEELEIEASSGGGMVNVKMNGQKKILSMEIHPEVINPEDPEMLQDLILAAINEATAKVEEEMANKLGGLTGGLGIPKLF